MAARYCRSRFPTVKRDERYSRVEYRMSRSAARAIARQYRRERIHRRTGDRFALVQETPAVWSSRNAQSRVRSLRTASAIFWPSALSAMPSLRSADVVSRSGPLRHSSVAESTPTFHTFRTPRDMPSKYKASPAGAHTKGSGRSSASVNRTPISVKRGRFNFAPKRSTSSIRSHPAIPRSSWAVRTSGG